MMRGGVKKYRTEIVADRIQFGPKAGGSATTGASGGYQAPQAPGVADIPHDDGGDSIEYPSGDINPEDIPF